MSIHKIIWATDGSKDSLKSLELSEILAKTFKASIHGIAVIPLYYSVVNNFPPEEKDRFLEWMDNTLADKKRETLSEIAEEFKQKGIEFNFTVVKGIPHEEIIKYADDEDADLISLGRGRIFERFFLGGTSLKVIRGTKKPVITTAEGKTPKDIRRILVPIAVVHGLSGNYDYALKMAGKLQGNIDVLNVVELGNLNVPLEIQEQLKGFALRDLVETIGAVRIPEITELHSMASGSGWRGIVEFAEKNDTDLIIMMSYGGTKVRDEFIGSTTEKVVQEAPCPVLTLSPQYPGKK